jgi:hypothetical protein
MISFTPRFSEVLAVQLNLSNRFNGLREEAVKTASMISFGRLPPR